MGTLAFVGAVPPVQTNTVIDKGLTIEVPMISYHKLGTSFDYHLHVHNSTNSLVLTNSSTTCTLHIYNNSGNGEHILKEVLDFDVDGLLDFKLNVLGGNFSSVGEYGVLFYCSGNGAGGFVEYTFTVNAEGREYGTTYAIIYSSMMFLLLLLFILCLLSTKLLPQNTVSDTNEILQISSLRHMRFMFYAFAYIILMAMIFIASNVSLAFFESKMMGGLLFNIFTIMFWSMIVILPLTIMVIFVYMFKDKELKQMLERGVGVSTL